MKWIKDTPWWVFAICAVLASIEPVTHFCLQRIDNAQEVHSGLHTPDSAIYLTCMRMFKNDFFSPYATVSAPNGPHDPAFLPTPFHWLYAILGQIGRWLGIGEFMFLGLANGFFGFIYLLVVYRFLKTAVPQLANLAFVLWSLGGGLGGLYFFASMAWDPHTSPAFEQHSFRWIMYELIEGPGLLPVLHIPRLYYTTSLALGFGFLSALITGIRTNCRRHLVFAALLLFGSALINIRFGAFAWSVACLYFLCVPNIPLLRSFTLACTMLGAALLAGSVFAAMQWSRPIFTTTALEVVRESIWTSGFISAAVVALPPFIVACRTAFRRLPRLPQILAMAAAGYLAILIPAVILYHLYYGNLWRGGDQSALALLSDFSLTGAVVGLLFGWMRSRPDPGDPYAPPDKSAAIHVDSEPLGHEWFVLWALVFLAAGMSSFGQGWGARLAPERFLAMLGVPFSVGVASILSGPNQGFGLGGRVYATLLVGLGVLSVAAGSLFFQAPVGRSVTTKAYSSRHVELISRADSGLIQRIPPGVVVLTTPALADVIAMRPDLRVIGGVGATDLSNESSVFLDSIYPRVCDDDSDPPFSWFELYRVWRVAYVLVPDNPAYGSEAGPAVGSSPDLELVASNGRGRLYKIVYSD